jgi:hypothetical protein
MIMVSTRNVSWKLKNEPEFQNGFLYDLDVSNIEYSHHTHAMPRLLSSGLLSIAQSICILVKHHIAFVTNILTHAASPPCCKENIGVIKLIMITHDLANCLSSFPTIIKWNSGAKVMSNMSLY